MKPLEWTEDLFSTVGQVLPEWVNSYCLFSRKKIEAGTLIFHDTVNDLQAAAAHQAKKNKPSWIARDTFELSFTGKNAKSLQRNISEQNDKKPAGKQKRRKLKSEREANTQLSTE